MAYIAVDKHSDEYIYTSKPERSDDAAHPIWIAKTMSYVKLPKGVIESLLHRKMTWEEEPIRLEDLWSFTFNKDNFEKVLKPRNEESINKAKERKQQRDMKKEEDNIKEEVIQIPKNKVVDRIVNGKIYLKDKENYKPDTWEDCVKEYEFLEYINDCGEIGKIDISTDEDKDIDSNDKNFIPPTYGKIILALMQLLICRNKYRGNWKPDWTNVQQIKHVIVLRDGKLVQDTNYLHPCIFAFETANDRNKFYRNFKDLIEVFIKIFE